MTDLERETRAEHPDRVEASTNSGNAEQAEAQETSSGASAPEGGSALQGDYESGADQARSNTTSRSLLIGVVGLGLVAGCGIGWLGHDFQVNKAAKDADSAVSGTGESARGPCKAWAEALCGSFGEKSYACRQATAASTLLSGSACAQAQKGLPKKIEEIEAGRAPCTELSSRLCSELGADGHGCDLVKDKTPTFSVEDCEKMTQDYDRVLAQIMKRQERGTLPK